MGETPHRGSASAVSACTVGRVGLNMGYGPGALVPGCVMRRSQASTRAEAVAAQARQGLRRSGGM
jgi:hypothetical protein